MVEIDWDKIREQVDKDIENEVRKMLDNKGK